MPNSFLLLDFNPPPLLLKPPRENAEFGPFPKSVYTYKLEELVRLLISNEGFEIKKPNSLVFTRTNESYNLEELLSNANLDHLTFNELDFRLYNQLVSNFSTPPFNSTLIKEREAEYQINYPNLSFAQMQSINIYTGGAFSYMNKFLRKQADFWDYSPTIVKASIIHSLICCSALSQAPDQSVKQAFRVEDLPSNDDDPLYLSNRVKAEESHATLNLEGFVSTSISRPSRGGEILYIFSELKGKRVQPLSQCPVENEFLIPPTQIKIQCYNSSALNENYKRFKHCFKVSTVNELSFLPENSLISPSLSQFISLTLNKIEYIRTNSQDNELNQCLSLALTTLTTVLAQTTEKGAQPLTTSERYCYTVLLDWNSAVDEYLSAKDIVSKQSILTNKLNLFINPIENLQPSFAMRVLSSEYAKPLAYTLLILGLGGLMIGTFGLAGVIGLGCVASITLASLGLSGIVTACSMFAYSFFYNKDTASIQGQCMEAPTLG